MAAGAPLTRGRGHGGAWLASNQVGLAIVILVFVAVFATATTGFTSPFNLYALGRVIAIDIVIGFSMMVVLATGGMNLAVGSIGVCAAMFAGWQMESLGLPILPACILALALGAALGWINGFALVRTGMNAFIVTLATMSIFFGAMILLSEAEAFRNLPAGFAELGRIRFWGFVSGLLLPAVVVTALLIWLYGFTAFGRRVLAVGANARAAELSGIRVGRILILSHMMSGGLAALAGLMLMARNGAALPSMTGQIGMDWLLPAFLAPVLGGTLLSGGAMSVVGALLGAVLVDLIRNGLLLLQFGDFWVQLVLGLVLLAAVLLDRLRSSLAARRGLAAA